MHAGTTSDVFLRENLEWLGLASNWSKFSATAGLGVIHKGYFEQGQTILGPYLPQSGGESNIPGANYSEGGALYALGLINAGCGSDVTTYLRDALKAAQGEVVQHGAALGLGVAGIGSKSLEAFEDLKNILFTDSAVAGEGAGYAMGLVMLGTAAAEPVREMLQYARETQHEKIIRGLAMGIAFIYYGRQEEADETIKLLLSEKVRSKLTKDPAYVLMFFRIQFFDTVAFMPWHLRTLEPPTTTPFASSFTLPSQTPQTMSAVLRSHP
jgi:26S proteasome regulatory subunit N2